MTSTSWIGGLEVRGQTLLAVATVAALLAVPRAAGASEPITELVALAGCLGGPGIAAARLTPASGGGTDLDFGGIGVWPHGPWAGRVTSRTTLTGPATTSVSARGRAPRGGLDVATTHLAAAWGDTIAGASFTSPHVGQRLVPDEAARTRCALSLGSIGPVSLAESAQLRLLVTTDGPGTGIAVATLGARPGSRWALTVWVSSAGGTQRQRMVIRVHRPRAAVPVPGIRNAGAFQRAKVVATNLASRQSFTLALLANPTEVDACKADVLMVTTASEAFYAVHGSYATAIDDAGHSPSTLVGGGFLHSPPAPESQITYNPATGYVTSAVC